MSADRDEVLRLLCKAVAQMDYLFYDVHGLTVLTQDEINKLRAFSESQPAQEKPRPAVTVDMLATKMLEEVKRTCHSKSEECMLSCQEHEISICARVAFEMMGGNGGNNG